MWKETVSVSPPYHFDRVLDRLSLDPLNAVNLDKREVKLPLRNQNKEPRIVAVQATELSKPRRLPSAVQTIETP